MAFPTVEGTSGDFVGTSNNTTHAVPYPTVSGGILANDLLLVFGALDTITAGGTCSWNGFSQLDWGDVGGTVSGSGGLAFLWAAGGESGTITFTTSVSERAVFRMYCIRGADPAKNPEIGTPSTGNSTNPDPPSLTPSWGALDTLWWAQAIIDSVVASAAPTNYGNFETLSGVSTNQLNTARRTFNATVDDPGVFTAATDQWRANTVAIAPLGGGVNISAPAAAATANSSTDVTLVISLSSAAAATANTSTEITKVVAVSNAAGATANNSIHSIHTGSGGYGIVGAGYGSGSYGLFVVNQDTTTVVAPPASATADTTTHITTVKSVPSIAVATANTSTQVTRVIAISSAASATANTLTDAPTVTTITPAGIATANTSTDVTKVIVLPNAGSAIASSVMGAAWAPHTVNLVELVEIFDQTTLVEYESNGAIDFVSSTLPQEFTTAIDVVGYQADQSTEYETTVTVISILNDVSFSDLQTEVSIIP